MTGAGGGRLAAVGWSDRVAALAAEVDDGEVGRVVRADRGHVRVTTGAEDELLLPAPPDLDDQGPPIVGDWVVVAGPGEERAVVEVLPRWSELVRSDPDETHRRQGLVANVDVVGVVCGLDRPLRPGRVERMLAAAWESGATPLSIVTKADTGDATELVGELERVALGVEVVVTSSVTGEGIDRLRALLADGHRTCVLLGESGAGKSRLVNALVGDEVQETGEVREGDAKGRHTTTHRQLVPLPGGGVLIDTPGVRAFALWDVDEGLRTVFADIEELAEGCRFRDCRHEAEPGCTVTEAVASGALDEDRFERYRMLRAEQESFELRSVEHERRAADRSAGRIYRQTPNRP